MALTYAKEVEVLIVFACEVWALSPDLVCKLEVMTPALACGMEEVLVYDMEKATPALICEKVPLALTWKVVDLSPF